MPPAPQGTESDKSEQTESVLPLNSGMAPMAETREQSIADSIKRSEETQKHFPGVDFTGAVIKPTVNFFFDLKEKISGEKQKEYNDLMSQMLEHAGEPKEAERLLYQARDCLKEIQDVLAQFDAIFIERQEVSKTIGGLEKALSIKSQLRPKGPLCQRRYRRMLNRQSNIVWDTW